MSKRMERLEADAGCVERTGGVMARVESLLAAVRSAEETLDAALGAVRVAERLAEGTETRAGLGRAALQVVRASGTLQAVREGIIPR